MVPILAKRLLEKKGIASYLEKTPVLVLDCNPDIENKADQLDKLLQEIVFFMEAPFMQSPQVPQGYFHSLLKGQKVR